MWLRTSHQKRSHQLENSFSPRFSRSILEAPLQETSLPQGHDHYSDINKHPLSLSTINGMDLNYHIIHYHPLSNIHYHPLWMDLNYQRWWYPLVISQLVSQQHPGGQAQVVQRHNPEPRWCPWRKNPPGVQEKTVYVCMYIYIYMLIISIYIYMWRLWSWKKWFY